MAHASAREGGSHRHLVELLLNRYGDKTFAAEAHIQLRDTPAPLFQLLVLSLMLSARIAADKAVSASASLFSNGLTTAEKMAGASWQERVDAITWSGYKRYDERTATMLGDTAQLVLDRYKGDLRNLHRETAGDVDQLHNRLQEFKGIGEVGANIFLREVQQVWDDVYPFADDIVLASAAKLGLPDDVKHLSELCERDDFSRLTAALVRVKLKHDQERVLQLVKGRADG